MRIYVAGPYTGTTGSLTERAANAATAITVGKSLIKKGHYPFIPHLTHYVEEDGGERLDYETYLAWDISFLRTCEGLLRIPGHSPGADREEKIAQEMGIPVWYSLDEVTDGE